MTHQLTLQTYPRQNGSLHTYVNDFISQGSMASESSLASTRAPPGGRRELGHSLGRSRSEKARDGANYDKAANNGAIHNADSCNSLKPFRSSNSLLCIQEVEAGRISCRPSTKYNVCVCSLLIGSVVNSNCVDSVMYASGIILYYYVTLLYYCIILLYYYTILYYCVTRYRISTKLL